MTVPEAVGPSGIWRIKFAGRCTKRLSRGGSERGRNVGNWGVARVQLVDLFADYNTLYASPRERLSPICSTDFLAHFAFFARIVQSSSIQGRPSQAALRPST